MGKIIELVKDKKTYIVATAVVTLGLLQGLDIFIMPDWAWPILAAVGLATMRAAVKKVAAEVKKL